MKKICIICAIVILSSVLTSMAYALDYSFLDYLTTEELEDLSEEVQRRIAEKKDGAVGKDIDPYSPIALFKSHADTRIRLDSLIKELKGAGVEYEQKKDDVIGRYWRILVHGNDGETTEFWYLYEDCQSNLIYITKDYRLLIDGYDKKELKYYYKDLKTYAEMQVKDLDALLDKGGIK